MQQVLEALDAAALRAWCVRGLQALTVACAEIDDLNVFPVPDGDTGTNLRLTMAAVIEAIEASAPGHEATVQAVTRGSLMGARGNSGVILSQLLRGLLEDLPEQAGPGDLVRGLRAGAASAYTAVGGPVEGTILTVAREAGEGAAGATLAEVVRSARIAAEQSLARTPDLLPALAAAGVVDAGGRGWCVLLEALESVVTGEQQTAEPVLLVPRDRSGLAVAREAGSDAFAYEVQFLLRETTEEAVVLLKEQLLALGDSLVVVGSDGLFNVHVHVNDVGAAVEAGVDAGRPFRITVSRFAEQVEQQVEQRQGAEQHRSGRAVVAVAAGAGLAALFRDAGATVVDGGPTANPSTAELLAAVRDTGAAEVVLLPNDSNVRAVALAAAQTARAEGIAVAVVPTRSVVQGLAAVSVADPTRAFDDDVAVMGSAAGGTRWAEVTTAVRVSATAAGPCRAGDALGLVDGAVVVVGTELLAVAEQLLQRLLQSGGELVTVVLGEQAGPEDGDRLAAYVGKEHPAVEVHVLEGGQPHYPYLLGVE